MSTLDITIYYHPYSQPSRSIRMLTHHFGCFDQINWVFCDMFKGETRTMEFLKINPSHTVPTLRDSARNLDLTESSAIIEYLSEIFDWKGKEWGIPVDMVGKFKVINALHNHHSMLRKTNMKIMACWFKTFLFKQEFDLPQFKRDVAEGKKIYKVLNDTLIKNNGWLAGTPSVADVHGFMEVFQLTNNDFAFCVYDFAEYPAIQSWIEKMYPLWFKDTDEDWLATRVYVKKTKELIPQMSLLLTGESRASL